MGPQGCLRDEEMSPSAGGCNVDADCRGLHMGASQNWGYHFRGPHNKDCSIWGSMLAPLILGNCHISGQGFWGCLVQPSYTRTVGE